MARILTRQGPDKFRLWCNTTDKWISPTLNALDTAKRLIEDEYEPHTFDEAYARITRKGYDKRLLKWLAEHFDNGKARERRPSRRD